MTNGEKYLKSLHKQLEITDICQEAIEAAFDLQLTPEAKNFANFLKRRRLKILQSIDAYLAEVKVKN